MKRILVVNVNWLGDAILTTPIFKALKEKFPSSFVAVMGVSRVKEVFEDNPYIDEVIIFDEKDKSIFAKINFARKLKEKNFDTAFLIHRSFSRAFICFLAKIKRRIGWRRLKNMVVLTTKITPPKEPLHRQDYYFYLFQNCGIEIKDKASQFFIPQSADKKIALLLKDLKDKYTYLVGVNPSANWHLKRWPKENFAHLCDRLIEELGCGIIFIGAKKDEPTVKAVLGAMKNKADDFSGRTTLKELGALMQNLNLFISNDSGPAHLAASLGRKTLVLFGPTSPGITAPRGESVTLIQKDVGCPIPCYNLNCQNNLCMKKISVEEAFTEAKRILCAC